MQGHNVYGSENLRLGIEYMLDALATAQPELFELLDVPVGVRAACVSVPNR